MIERRKRIVEYSDSRRELMLAKGGGARDT